MTTEATQMDTVQDLAHQAIGEVFKTMLGMEISSENPAALPFDPAGEVVSSVGFIGQITGAVYLYATAGFARVLTSRMLGLAEEEVDAGEIVNDALGELSNMVVGYVKSRLCDRGFSCTLTIPSIVRGQGLSVEKPASVTTRIFGFKHENHRLLAEIFVKEV